MVNYWMRLEVITKKRDMEDLIKALQIFLKYGNPRCPTNCSHDELFVCIDPQIVSSDDKKALDKLGFFVSEEGDDGFISYRFGSC